MSTLKILQIRATDQFGNYLNGVQICLTSEKGKKIKIKTDERGLASLKVPIGSYCLKAGCGALYRNVKLDLKRDESLSISLFPKDAAYLTLQTFEKDKKGPLPSYIIITGNAFAFSDCLSNYISSTGALFTDEKGITSLLLPPGKFTLKATYGFNYQPVEKKITLKKGERKKIKFILEKKFDLPIGWYCGDDHVHCQQCWPGNHPGQPNLSVSLTAKAARANGLDWITISDSLDPASPLYTPIEKREEETVPGKFFCLIGEEPDGYNKDGFFHCNLIGIKALIGSKGNIGRMKNIIKEVRQQGGTTNICHIFFGPGALREIEENPDLPNLEVWDGSDNIDKSMPIWYNFLNRKRKLYAVAHSDSIHLHWPGEFVGVRRTYIYNRKKPFSKEAIISSLRDGHSFCTDGPLLLFNVNGKMPGESLEVKAKEKLKVEIEAFSLTPLVKIALVASGKKIREWSASGNSFQIKEELKVDNFSWILATVEAKGTIYAPARKFKGFAFTNPIWIKNVK